MHRTPHACCLGFYIGQRPCHKHQGACKFCRSLQPPHKLQECNFCPLSSQERSASLPCHNIHPPAAGFLLFRAIDARRADCAAEYGQRDSNGLRELYDDCHVGWLLRGGARTWSLMQLERAQLHKQLTWRRNDARLKKHVQKMKDIYFEIWRCIVPLAAAGASYEAARDEVADGFSMQSVTSVFLCSIESNQLQAT